MKSCALSAKFPVMGESWENGTLIRVEGCGTYPVQYMTQLGLRDLFFILCQSFLSGLGSKITVPVSSMQEGNVHVSTHFSEFASSGGSTYLFPMKSRNWFLVLYGRFR